ncbi:hypothetical protein G5B37_05840 [Rasiella rasia]|uniref:Ubiquinone biosynthesis protein COQ4 n=1 Tax=Rasiella rasia TaxID=2744027 RepID=A0A6G6GQP8_9FLAO|nr:hypothetical protein G5B37_05840 [Rasiella rasia]
MRKQLINWLFEKSMMLYCRFKNKQAWNITTEELLQMSHHTFGHHLGTFLNQNGFELIPKVERHDAYHVLTGMGTTVEEEIALQYICFANGKRTPYLFGVLLLGTLILPDYASLYIKAYRFGKNARTFHHFDYKQVLPVPFHQFQDMIFSEAMRKQFITYKSTQISAI